MLGSILSPVGDGHRTTHTRLRWLGRAALYALASAASATTFAGLLLFVAWPISPENPVRATAPLLAAAGALVYAPRLLTSLQWPPLFQSTWQVPRRWSVDYRRWQTALLFGLFLGSGISTRIVVPTYYLLIIWSFVLPDPGSVVTIWALYGFVRSLPLLWQAAIAPPSQPAIGGLQIVSIIMRNAKQMKLANGYLLLCVAFVAAAEWASR